MATKQKRGDKVAQAAKEHMARDPRERVQAVAFSAGEQARNAEQALQDGRDLASAVQAVAEPEDGAEDHGQDPAQAA